MVIPYVANLSDKIGRRPPVIFGALAAGLLSFGYLYAISIHNVPLAIVMSLLMWGVVYQGYNAVFPSFYPELFPARTRVSARETDRVHMNDPGDRQAVPVPQAEYERLRAKTLADAAAAKLARG